jgi:hypothetical protein
MRGGLTRRRPLGGGKRRCTIMSSPNPGISAAGEAAGRTAQNPSSGPAAIGGMLSEGEPEVEPSDDVTLRSRLKTAISDIAKLAHAMGALSMDPTQWPRPSDEELAVQRDHLHESSAVAPDAVGGGSSGATYGRGPASEAITPSGERCHVGRIAGDLAPGHESLPEVAANPSPPLSRSG